MKILYLLFIDFSIISGILLCADFLKEKTPGFSKFIDIINTKEVKFITGIVTFIVGFLKLIFPDGWIIVGDLAPSAIALIAGSALLLDFYKETATISSDLLIRLDGALLKNRNLIGMLSIVIGLIHVFFADVPLFL
jgi:hypothetical protein